MPWYRPQKEIPPNGLIHNPAVAILGPRQIGKTTLALEIAKTRESVYLDLESPQDLAKLQDPISYFSIHQGKLIILDEVIRGLSFKCPILYFNKYFFMSLLVIGDSCGIFKT